MTTTTISHRTRQRLTGALFVSQSLFSAAMIAAFTLSPILAAELGGSDNAAGVPNTLTLLGRALAAYPIGWLFDKVGRRLGLTIGFVLALFGAAVTVWAVLNSSFIGFCAGAALMGMGRGGSDQGRYVAAEVQTADRRAKVIGLIVFAGTIGAVGGPALVGPSVKLAEAWGFLGDAGPYLAALGLYALGLLTIFVFLRPDPKQVSQVLEAENPAEDTDVTVRPLTQIFSQPAVLLAVAAMAIGQLVMALIMVITPLHMDHNNHSTESVSLVIMAHTLGMFGLSSITGWLIDRYGRIPLIVAGAALLIISGILAPLSVAVPNLAIALFLLGLGWNFCFIAGSSLLADALAARERARAQGASEVLVSLATGVGSLGTGAVFNQGGMTAVAAVGIALSLLLFAALFWFNRWQQHTTPIAPI
ncbi:MAG: MFS transporter [Ardenticatenaceae bacterium]|nr:MFS transporter [Anaerolineales bacterium]MCB9006832.1 MFS transporter [Ardenticatenaceae bacterium]